MKAKLLVAALLATALVCLGLAATTVGFGMDDEQEPGVREQRDREMNIQLFQTADLDSDGIPNCEDPDDDADGITDSQDEYPHDHDNDGVPDIRDDDDDDDGIPDSEDDEYVGNTPEMEPRQKQPRNRHRRRLRHDLHRRLMMGDLDSDGIPNCEDPDDDGDGINDSQDEFPHDHDNDGMPDHRDRDDDNDGVPDSEDDEYVGNCPMPPMPRRNQEEGQR